MPQPETTALDGVAAFAAAIVDPMLPPPADAIVAHGDLASRFAIYRNNVWVARLGVLDDLFPVCRRLVGAEAFRVIGRRFFLEAPPSLPVAHEWADPFAEWLAGSAYGTDWPWFVDVARLEAAWMRAHHAAEAEPIGRAALAGIAPEALAETGLRLHPSASLVVSSFPVGSIWAAHQGEGEPAPLEHDGPETVLVLRPDADVLVVVVSAAEAAFVAALALGESIGAAAEAALDRDPGFDPGARLVALVDLGAVIAIA